MSDLRPSFVLFVTDQHNARFLGCYGHPILSTPHIDAIAARGVAFDRFYVASPVCMPNRASLMTGRMPSVHGVLMNGQALDRRNVTFVEMLRAAGYDTALIGKSHLQTINEDPPPLPRPEFPAGYFQPPAEMADAVRHDLGEGWYRQESPGWWANEGARVEIPYYGFDHVELVCGHGDGAGGDYGAWLLEREPDALNLVGAENQKRHDYVCPQAIRTSVPSELYHTSFIAERAAAYLERRAGDETPFFLMVSFPDPHHPFNPPGDYWDMYDPDDFPVPEAYTRNDWQPPPHVAWVQEARRAGGPATNGQLSLGVEARHAREAQALTCGMIACIDDAVGKVVVALGRAGRTGDAVVAFTADHGDHLGNHRLLLKGPEQYADIIRVPFIWADPAAPEPGRRCDALGSTIDIPATILDRARIAPYFGLQGESLGPLVAGERTDHRESILVQYDHQTPLGPDQTSPRIQTIADGRWRLSLFEGADWGELYDLEADPGEFVNLWDDPAYTATKADLIHQLAKSALSFLDRAPYPTSRA